MQKSKIIISSLIIGLLLGGTVLLFDLNQGRFFEGETDIIVLAKSEGANRTLNQIMANVKNVPLSLSFYDKLVERYPELMDQAAEKTDFARRNAWQNKIALMQKGESGIIAVIAKDEDRSQAELFSQRTAEDVAVIMGRYYDTNKDVEIHVVDGPIVSEKTRTLSAGMIISSLLIALIFAFISGALMIIFKKFTGNLSQKFSKTPFPEKNTFDLDHSEKPMVSHEFPLLEEMPFAINEKKEIEKIENTDKKAEAPANLPIVDGGIFSEVISQEHQAEAIRKEEALLGSEKEEVSVASLDQHKREATPEEIRERLNKLLRGGK